MAGRRLSWCITRPRLAPGWRVCLQRAGGAQEDAMRFVSKPFGTVCHAVDHAVGGVGRAIRDPSMYATVSELDLSPGAPQQCPGLSAPGDAKCSAAISCE